MNHFKVGEIVILKCDPTFTDPGLEKYDGEEGEVTGPYGIYFFADGSSELCYKITMRDGEEVLCKPHELRRRPPKTREIDEVVSWGDCAWKPVKEVA
jgi:ribosomal protein L21E